MLTRDDTKLPGVEVAAKWHLLESVGMHLHLGYTVKIPVSENFIMRIRLTTPVLMEGTVVRLIE